jgi:hypothetical protein
MEEGGWTRYKLISQTNPANLANNRSTKLRALIGSARADHPHHQCGPSGPRAGLSGPQFGAQHMPPAFWWS